MNILDKTFETHELFDCHGIMHRDRVVSCSKGLLYFLSPEIGSIIGRSILDFSPSYQANGEMSRQQLEKRLDATLNGLPQSFEWRFKKEDGSYVNTLFSFEQQTLDDSLQHFMFQIRIIDTGNAKADPVRNSKDLLQQMLDNSTSVVYVKDELGRFQFVNREFTKLFNISEQQIVGKSAFDIFPQETAQSFIDNDKRVFETQQPMEFEETAEVDGETHTYSTTKFPLFNRKNRVYAVCGVSTDITAKKKTDDAFKSVALGVSGSSYDNVFDSIVWHLAETLDVELAFIGRYLPDHTVNTISIYSRGKIIENVTYGLDKTPCDGVVGKDYLFLPKDVQQLFPGDGMLASLDLEAYAGFPLYDSKGIQQGLISIGSERPLKETYIIRSVLEIFSVRASAELERLEAEDKLRSSEELYRVIFNSSVDGLLVFSESGQIIDVNPVFKMMHGYEGDTDFGKIQPQDIIPSDHIHIFQDYIHTVNTQGRAHIVGQGLKRDGTRCVLDIHGVKMSQLGKVQLLTIVRDITEKNRAEEALRQSEDRLRATFEAALDAIISMDESGTIIEFNPAAEACFGYSREKAIGSNLADLIIPMRFRDAHKGGMQKFKLGGHGPLIGKRIEVEAMRANGSEFSAELAIDVTEGAEGKVFIGYMRDITEQKSAESARVRLEAQLRQAQKMEAIGHLTGGIAHDFNNILTSVMGNLMLAEELSEKYQDAKLSKYLTRACRSGEKARNLIQQMLTFSRGQRGEPRALSLEPLVKEASKLLEASLPSSVEIELDVSSNTSQIMIDPVHLEQILVNLCINARDAVSANGCILIGVKEHECITCGCESCKQSFDGSYVELSVKDNGTGISREVLDRMFEPFYSTKEVGKGSGMGLSTVHGIVHDYGGHIKVDTKMNGGTAINIFLPALNNFKTPPSLEAKQVASATQSGLMSGPP